jgi:outer membrane protein TolC
LAYVTAQRAVDAAKAAYDAGTVTLEFVLNTEERELAVQLALLDAERRYGDPSLLQGQGR